MRFCPRCHLLLEPAPEPPLRAELYCCRNCGGCWLGGGASDQSNRGDWLADLDRLYPGRPIHESYFGLKLLCPDCRLQELEERPYPSTEIAVRTCSQCQGVWLDPGVRTQIAETFAPQPHLPRTGEEESRGSEIARPELLAANEAFARGFDKRGMAREPARKLETRR